jgi:hypothetical protein
MVMKIYSLGSQLTETLPAVRSGPIQLFNVGFQSQRRAVLGLHFEALREHVLSSGPIPTDVAFVGLLEFLLEVSVIVVTEGLKVLIV